MAMFCSQLKSPGRALKFANYGHFLNHVIMLVYPTIALTLSDLWSKPYGELLSAFFIGSLIYGFASYPAGWLSDRWSSWGMMAIYLVGTGVATIATGFSETTTQLILGLSFIGLFASIYHPVGTAFVVRHASNRALDLGRNGAWGTAGLALSAFIAAGLTYLLNWRAAFFVPGVVCLGLGLLFILTTRPIDSNKSETGSRTKPRFADILVPHLVRVLLVMTVTVLVVGLFTQAFTTGLPNLYDNSMSFLVKIFDWDDSVGRTLSAAFVSAVILFGALGQIIGGALSSRYSPKTVYIGMFVFILPLTLISSGLEGFPLVFVGALMMIAVTGCLPAENCILVHFAPSEWHGRLFSLKFVVGLGGGSAALLANGYIFDKTEGFFWFFSFLALMSLIVIIGGLLLPKIRNDEMKTAALAE